MSINLPSSDCQAFRIKCMSGDKYVAPGRWHDIPTYTTTGDSETAMKFVRFKMGSAASPGFSGAYVIMDENGNLFSFNQNPDPYSFAVPFAWGQNAAYQTFDMGEIGSDEPNFIKVHDQDYYAARFKGNFDNQIIIDAKYSGKGLPQEQYLLEPVPGSGFSIPELTPEKLQKPVPGQEYSDVAWINRSVIPRFLVSRDEHVTTDPLKNPYYIIDEGIQWRERGYILNDTNSKSPQHIWTEEIGVSKSTETTVTQETSLNMEMSAGGALKGVDLSLSLSITHSWGWSRTDTSCWTSSSSKSIQWDADPMTTKYAYQQFSLWMMRSLDMTSEKELARIGLPGRTAYAETAITKS